VNAVIIALNARANILLQDERFVVFVFQVLRLCVDELQREFFAPICELSENRPNLSNANIICSAPR
jgi:hypothetical protein